MDNSLIGYTRVTPKLMHMENYGNQIKTKKNVKPDLSSSAVRPKSLKPICDTSPNHALTFRP